MTVSAPSGRGLAESANIARPVAELRRGGGATAGSYLYEGSGLITGWHSHEVHLIEYALHGVVEVETDSARYLLPPQQAAWIPAGLEHQAVMNPDVKTVAVMFDPTLIADAGGRPSGDAPSDGFFRTLADLVAKALDHEAPLSLPTCDDPVVAAAMTYTKEHLDSVTSGEVSRAVAVSERTLRRLFELKLGLSWRTYLLNARMLRAMALLASPAQSVQETSTAVGFDSLSSFSRAFSQLCGETPTAYRKRVAGERL